MLQIGIREPGSAITHFIAMMMAIIASSPLLVKAALDGNRTTVFAMAVFMGSMVLLYGASTVYHSLVVRDKILKVFRKLDHMMIFVLIADSLRSNLYSSAANSSRNRLLKRNMASTDTIAAATGLLFASLVFILDCIFIDHSIGFRFCFTI